MKTLIDLNSLIQLPIRNVWRNRRRSMITISGIALACFCLMVFAGYIRMMEVGLTDNAIKTEFGHLQIARSGYFEADAAAADFMVPIDEFKRIEELLLDMDAVDFVNMRLHLFGIIGNSERSTVFSAICGIPDFEVMMTPSIISGGALSDKDPDGIVIGQALSNKLGSSIGDNLLLFFSGENGSQEAIFGRIKGLYHGISLDQEKVVIYLPLETAWELILERKAHRLLVFLNDKQDINAVKTELESFIAEHQLNLEVKDWESLAVFHKQVIAMFQGFLLVAGLILSIIVVFNISNTMYMTITERTKEIGTMRALGDRSIEIMRLLFLEGCYLGLFGGVLGSVIAFAFIPAINYLNFALPPGPGQVDPTPVQIIFDGQIMGLIAFCAILVASFASILPAFKATRIKIADALRFN